MMPDRASCSNHPSLAGGLVESDIADLRQIPPLGGLFRVMPDHAPEACVVHVHPLAKVLMGIAGARERTNASKSQVNPLPSHAQGTGTKWMPQASQWTLGTLAVR